MLLKTRIYHRRYIHAVKYVLIRRYSLKINSCILEINLQFYMKLTLNKSFHIRN